MEPISPINEEMSKLGRQLNNKKATATSITRHTPFRRYVTVTIGIIIALEFIATIPIFAAWTSCPNCQRDPTNPTYILRKAWGSILAFTINVLCLTFLYQYSKLVYSAEQQFKHSSKDLLALEHINNGNNNGKHHNHKLKNRMKKMIDFEPHNDYQSIPDWQYQHKSFDDVPGVACCTIFVKMIEYLKRFAFYHTWNRITFSYSAATIYLTLKAYLCFYHGNKGMGMLMDGITHIFLITAVTLLFTSFKFLHNAYEYIDILDSKLQQFNGYKNNQSDNISIVETRSQSYVIHTMFVRIFVCQNACFSEYIHTTFYRGCYELCCKGINNGCWMYSINDYYYICFVYWC